MKGYLKIFLDREKTEKLLVIEPAKPAKTNFEGFAGSQTESFFQNQGLPVKDLAICPICMAEVKREKSGVLNITFCPLGCPLLVCRFTHNREAVYKAVSEMFDTITSDELQAVSDALDERAAILMIENGWQYERAMREAEQDILPSCLDRYNKHLK